MILHGKYLCRETLAPVAFVDGNKDVRATPNGVEVIRGSRLRRQLAAVVIGMAQDLAAVGCLVECGPSTAELSGRRAQPARTLLHGDLTGGE